MQLNFFEPSASQLARKSDGDTSKAAAASVTKSGKASRQRRAVLRAVIVHPGKTTAELAVKMSTPSNVVSRQVPGRRMIELERLGWVTRGDSRFCSVNGTKARTYHATEAGVRIASSGKAQ
tara:strand:+ start:499 stop:861 length:363 start_codon:yes stop_codon:yes gene_type:complete